MKRLGVGIVGFHHLHSLDYLPHFDAIGRSEVRAVAEADPAYLERVCLQTGIDGYEDYNTLLAREDIGLVVILLPHAECPDAVERAASSGKHVIVEKPMADTSEGIRRMIAATEKAGVTLSSPYCWRAHPASRKIKELVDRGILGQIVALEGRCAAGSPLRYLDDGISPWLNQKAIAGGGPMHNLGTHWIDLFRWFLKDEVQQATGMVSHLQHRLDIEDNSFGIVRFRSGATATLDISYSVPKAYPAGRDLFIGLRGSLGTVSWSPAWGGTADEVFVVSDHPDFTDEPRTTLKIASEAADGYGGVSGRVYLSETVDAILDGKPPGISGNDGLKALEVVEAIYGSAERGRVVVLGNGGA
ncbi:MAG: Gfo/Idh/MocA family oxidoreductase [Gemmatimonadetes bacterium]|nr:Gfo/Idh/MocA family oxidoreductase [Gemmatimonadota bacterium]MDE3260059.1 Gfo/Idh/MocA family oxidoreductase [Gemmatimonadota bacterium]